jgi:hypothetical protein
MAVQYTNRKRITYYLHEDNTKTGDLRYFFSARNEGNLVDTLPEGYEIYEHPYSQVFLRPIQPQIITENERDAVNKHVRTLTPSRRYIIDIWGKDITVFESHEDIDVLKEVFRKETPEGFSLAEAIDFTVSFRPVLRFTLENIEKRSFIAKHYCLPGAVYEWRCIAGQDSLENLASEYVKYLGTESFYALRLC